MFTSAQLKGVVVPGRGKGASQEEIGCKITGKQVARNAEGSRCAVTTKQHPGQSPLLDAENRSIAITSQTAWQL